MQKDQINIGDHIYTVHINLNFADHRNSLHTATRTAIIEEFKRKLFVWKPIYPYIQNIGEKSYYISTSASLCETYGNDVMGDWKYSYELYIAPHYMAQSEAQTDKRVVGTSNILVDCCSGSTQTSESGIPGPSGISCQNLGKDEIGAPVAMSTQNVDSSRQPSSSSSQPSSSSSQPSSSSSQNGQSQPSSGSGEFSEIDTATFEAIEAELMAEKTNFSYMALDSRNTLVQKLVGIEKTVENEVGLWDAAGAIREDDFADLQNFQRIKQFYREVDIAPQQENSNPEADNVNDQNPESSNFNRNPITTAAVEPPTPTPLQTISPGLRTRKQRQRLLDLFKDAFPSVYNSAVETPTRVTRSQTAAPVLDTPEVIDIEAAGNVVPEVGPSVQCVVPNVIPNVVPMEVVVIPDSLEMVADTQEMNAEDDTQMVPETDSQPGVFSQRSDPPYSQDIVDYSIADEDLVIAEDDALERTQEPPTRPESPPTPYYDADVRSSHSSLEYMTPPGSRHDDQEDFHTDIPLSQGTLTQYKQLHEPLDLPPLLNTIDENTEDPAGNENLDLTIGDLVMDVSSQSDDGNHSPEPVYYNSPNKKLPEKRRALRSHNANKRPRK